MQVTETLNEGLKRGYEITVSAAELDAKVTEKLTEAQPEVEMKGFRKGKVPMALLRKQFGQRLLGEAMQETIDGAMNAQPRTSSPWAGGSRCRQFGFGGATWCLRSGDGAGMWRGRTPSAR